MPTVVYNYNVPHCYLVPPKHKRDWAYPPAYVHSDETWQTYQLIYSDQLVKSKRYRNALAQAERDRRDKINEAANLHHPQLKTVNHEIGVLTAAIQAKRDAIRNANQAKRKSTTTDEEREEITTMREALKECYGDRDKLIKKIYAWPPHIQKLLSRKDKLHKELGLPKRYHGSTDPRIMALDKEIAQLKQAFYHENPFRKELDQIDKDNKEVCLKLREQSGLDWGIYQLIEMDASRFRTGPPPRDNWNLKEGRIGIHIQNKSLSVHDAVAGTDDRLKIIVHEGKRTAIARLRWSIPQNGERKLVYMDVPFVMYRPLPDDGFIKWIVLSWEQVGSKFKLMLQFTVLTSQTNQKADSQAAFVGLNWSKLPNGTLRSTTWIGSDGTKGHIDLEYPYFLGRHKYIGDLQTRRELNLDRAKGSFLSLAQEMVLPAWMQEEMKVLLPSKSPRKWAIFLSKWSRDRFDDDDQLYAILDHWLRTDKRIWDEQAHLRRRMLLYRKWVYRNAACHLAADYHTITVPKQNRKMQQMKRLPESKRESQEIRMLRKLVAHFDLITCIKHKAADFREEKRDREDDDKKEVVKKARKPSKTKG